MFSFLMVWNNQQWQDSEYTPLFCLVEDQSHSAMLLAFSRSPVELDDSFLPIPEIKTCETIQIRHKLGSQGTSS